MPTMKTGLGPHNDAAELAGAALNVYPRLKRVFEQYPVLYSSEHAIVILAALHDSNALLDPLFEQWLIAAFCYGAVDSAYLLAMKNVSVILPKHGYLQIENLRRIATLNERHFIFFGFLLNQLETQHIFLCDKKILGFLLNNFPTLKDINNTIMLFGYDETRILKKLCETVREEVCDFTGDVDMDGALFFYTLNVFLDELQSFSFLDVNDIVKEKLREYQAAVKYICKNAMSIEQFIHLPETTQNKMLKDSEHACASFEIGFRLEDFLTLSAEIQDKILNCNLNTIEFIARLYYSFELRNDYFLQLLLDNNIIEDISDNLRNIFSSFDESELAIASALASLYLQQPIREIDVAALLNALSAAKEALHPQSMARNFFTPKKQIKREGDCHTPEKRTRTPSPAALTHDPLARNLFTEFRACTPEPNPSPDDRGPSA